MNRLITCGLIAGLLACGIAGAADSDWHVYYDASAVNRLTCIGDSLWCATNGGILLLDLTDTTVTQYIDGLGLPSSHVTAVTVDGNGSVWAGFVSGGVVRIDNIDTAPFVQRYSAARELLLSDSITAMAATGDDVYYGSTNGVAKFFDNFHSRESGLTEKTEGVRIYDLFPQGDKLWIGCENGVILFDRNTLFDTLYSIGSVVSLCEYEGNMHCVGDGGALVFDGTNWLPLLPSWDKFPLAIASGGGELVCATKERAYRWTGSYWAGIDAGGMKDLFAEKYRTRWNDILTTVAVDRRGSPWVGGVFGNFNRGVYVAGYVEGEWQIRAPEAITHNDIVRIDVAPGEGVWVSTSQFGISYLSLDGAVQSYTKMRVDMPSDPERLTYLYNNLAFLYDSQGYLWCNVLTFDLDMLKVNDPLVADDDEWAHFSMEDNRSITADRFVRAKEDPAGNRWFLSDDEQQDLQIWGINIASADTTHWMSINPGVVPSMEGGSVFDCAFGEQSVFLALRDYGVQEWMTGGFDWASLSSTAGDIWRTIIGPTQLASTDLWAIEIDAAGGLWIGTSSGVVRYRSGVLDSLTKKQSFSGEGLLGSIVYDLELDRYGVMWVATESGLNKITPDGTIEAFTTELEWRGMQFVYPSSVISPLPAATCKALRYDETADLLWIGTINGLASLSVAPPTPELIPLSEMVLYPNPVHISRGDRDLRIWRISTPVDVEVYTLEGELVHEARNVAEGDVAWDLLTLNGYSVRSGVYIVRISSEQFSEMRKVAVIR
ncbi:MAG TPA: T9SS type A sorting domain-containing protein [Patescibacteria group bacterium]|nr:T9SS type A sorting domain-containing protein [Patescibacteria group bacterium]